jgi:CheY-like chemotaxis protein
MSRLKVAILEDDREALDRLDRMLNAIGSVQVVVKTDKVDVLYERIRTRAPDALLLDIEINSDEEAGLKIAERAKLPVLFISGRTDKDIRRIEQIQRARLLLPVEHLSKPYIELDLKQALERFILLIEAMSKPNLVWLPNPKREKEQFRLAEIVMIRVPGSDKHKDMRSSEENKLADGNNREVVFTERKPFIAANLTLERLSDYGFAEDSLVPISRGIYVNPDRVIRSDGSVIEVEYMGAQGLRERVTLKVTEGHAKALKARMTKRG